MPQLDIVSYFPQFFWFCIFFTGFYVVLIQNYLPKLTRIIAVREALQPSPDQISSNTQESDTVTTKTHEVFAKTVHQTKEKCVQQFTETQNLLNIQTDVFNKHTNQAFAKYQTKKNSTESNSETNFTTNANSFTRTQITLFSHESETNLTIFFPSFSK